MELFGRNQNRDKAARVLFNGQCQMYNKLALGQGKFSKCEAKSDTDGDAEQQT